jgi:hypothetical protein
MEYASIDEFLEEWGKPDSMNFMTGYSYSSKDAVSGFWHLTIAQPRKMRFQEVTIGPVLGHESSMIEALAKKSIEVLQNSLEDDKRYALDEYRENRK